MFDLAMLAAGGLLVFRGWRKGLLRQVAGFVALVFSLLLVVRLAPSWATLVEDWLGIPYGGALALVGLALFAGVGIAVWAALQALTRMMRFPGLTTLDRAAGAALGLVWLVVWVMALVWFASFLPLPDTFTDMLSESRVVGRVTEPDNLPRRLLDSVTQDRWEEMLIRIGEITGRVDNLLRDLLGDSGPQL
ncbi:MAG: CvpA family protein [Acidimicrobiia bacterium]|nr:CvpA family protein [Acidimicrobiia bacterium]